MSQLLIKSIVLQCGEQEVTLKRAYHRGTAVVGAYGKQPSLNGVKVIRCPAGIFRNVELGSFGYYKEITKTFCEEVYRMLTLRPIGDPAEQYTSAKLEELFQLAVRIAE